MNRRQQRLEIIRDILAQYTVGNQEELLALLAARQIVITQATLSRDLKALRMSKVSTHRGDYRYVAVDKGGSDTSAQPHPASSEAARKAAVLWVRRVNNLVILKTHNGYAGSVASDLDMINSPLIAGTVAGVDTVFVALYDDAPLGEVYELLCSYLPERIIYPCKNLFK